MKIGVDAFPLASRTSSGIPNYIRNVLLGLLGIDSENEYFLYSRNPFNFPDAPNLRKRFSPGASEGSTSYGNTLWLFTKGIRMMKDDGTGLLWGTRQMLPPYLPGKTKKVLTVYDLVWHHFPETMQSYNWLISKLLFKRSIRSADHIIVISRASARSLTEILGVPEESISVAYPAADNYSPIGKNEAAEYIAEKYGTGSRYILTVSTVEPRKNLSTMLKVFARLKKEGLKLLIAGASGWKTSSIFEEYARLGLSENEVHFLGYVPDEDMNRLYSGAQVFVFPSIYEGFGIPPLEAMASGTPVIVSNSSSLPEVAGDAGILLDPYDEAGWREAILKVVSDDKLREQMRDKGLLQAKRFSWENSARRILEVFERVIK